MLNVTAVKLGSGHPCVLRRFSCRACLGRKEAWELCMLFTFLEMDLRGWFGGVGPHPDEKRATHMYQINGGPQQIERKVHVAYLGTKCPRGQDATGQLTSSTETTACFFARMVRQLDVVDSLSVGIPRLASPVALVFLSFWCFGAGSQRFCVKVLSMLFCATQSHQTLAARYAIPVVTLIHFPAWNTCCGRRAPYFVVKTPVT